MSDKTNSACPHLFCDASQTFLTSNQFDQSTSLHKNLKKCCIFFHNNYKTLNMPQSPSRHDYIILQTTVYYWYWCPIIVSSGEGVWRRWWHTGPGWRAVAECQWAPSRLRWRWELHPGFARSATRAAARFGQQPPPQLLSTPAEFSRPKLSTQVSVTSCYGLNESLCSTLEMWSLI